MLKALMFQFQQQVHLIFFVVEVVVFLNYQVSLIVLDILLAVVFLLVYLNISTQKQHKLEFKKYVTTDELVFKLESNQSDNNEKFKTFVEI